jgi:hypothetical protein
MDDLIGYEGFYKINRQGEIWSCRQMKIMKCKSCCEGYLHISLMKDGKKQQYCIHRLLAIQYIPNPDNKPVIDHIDHNRSNNDLSNLRWATQPENRNNMEDKEGKVYVDTKNTIRLGHEYYRATFVITIDGIRRRKYKSHQDKELLEEWVRTKGGIVIPFNVSNRTARFAHKNSS